MGKVRVSCTNQLSRNQRRDEQWLQLRAHMALPASVFDEADVLAPGTTLCSREAKHAAVVMRLGTIARSFVSHDKRLLATDEEHDPFHARSRTTSDVSRTFALIW